jgi:hypothetical protein
MAFVGKQRRLGDIPAFSRQTHTMRTIKAYRRGTTYSLEPRGAGDEPVTLVLAEGVRLARGGFEGPQLLYREGEVYGKSLAEAMRLEWCWLEESPAPEG